MNFQRMTDLDLTGKRVLIREDLNVPVKNGVRITSDARLRAALATIKAALAQGAALMVYSHLGRPVEGEPKPEQSLAPVAAYLTEALGQDVQLVTDYLDGVEVAAGRVVLLENCRFNAGEKKNNPELAAKYAALCDVFVMDAFGTAHRAEASTEGVARLAKVAAAGPLLAAELDALGRALQTPEKPMVAIVAGSKVFDNGKYGGCGAKVELWINSRTASEFNWHWWKDIEKSPANGNCYTFVKALFLSAVTNQIGVQNAA